MDCDKIFNADYATSKKPKYIKDEPIREYSIYIEPHKDENAIKLGEQCVKEMTDNFIADFEKNDAFVKTHGGNVDLMCHVSTLYKISGKIYVSYYANESTGEEDPKYQVARIAFCDENDTSNMTILDVQKVGDTLGDKTVDRVYDTIMMYEGGDLIYVLWTASLDGKYYRLVRTFNIKTNEFGDVKVNRLKVGNIINDFCTSGIESAFAENDILQKVMFSDIGIMQKLSYRIENGKTYYYTGAYSGYLTFIIKTTDFITWEYVATPDFINFSVWENATYVLEDKVFYFVRQRDCNQGFLTYYTKKFLPNVKMVLMEPFVLKGTATDSKYDEFLDVKKYATIVQKLARTNECGFIPLQSVLDQYANSMGADYILYDGVHPTVVGAKIIANEWIKYFENNFQNT